METTCCTSKRQLNKQEIEKPTTSLRDVREKTEQSTRHIDLRRCSTGECRKIPLQVTDASNHATHKMIKLDNADMTSCINVVFSNQGQAICRVKPLPRCTVVSEDGKKTSFSIQNQNDGSIKIFSNGKEYDPGEKIKNRLARMKIPQCKAGMLLPYEESLSLSDLNDYFMTDTDTSVVEQFSTATKLIPTSKIATQTTEYEECKKKIKEMSASLQNTTNIIKNSNDKAHKKPTQLAKDTSAKIIEPQQADIVQENLITKTITVEEVKPVMNLQKLSNIVTEWPEKSENTLSAGSSASKVHIYRSLSRMSAAKKQKKVSFDNVVNTLTSTKCNAHATKCTFKSQIYRNSESSDTSSSCQRQPLKPKRFALQRKTLQTNLNAQAHLAQPKHIETIEKKQESKTKLKTVNKLKPSAAQMQTADVPLEGKFAKIFAKKSNLTRTRATQDFLKSLEDRQLYIPFNKKNRRKRYECYQTRRFKYLVKQQTSVQKAKKTETERDLLHNFQRQAILLVKDLFWRVLSNSFASFVFCNAIGSLTSYKLAQL